MITFSYSSQSRPLCSVSRILSDLINCYEVSSKVGKTLFSDWCLTVTTKHCLAIVWLPTISLTCLSVGYLTFICRVEDTAPKAWSQGLAKMAVYEE